MNHSFLAFSWMAAVALVFYVDVAFGSSIDEWKPVSLRDTQRCWFYFWNRNLQPLVMHLHEKIPVCLRTRAFSDDAISVNNSAFWKKTRVRDRRHLCYDSPYASYHFVGKTQYSMRIFTFVRYVIKACRTKRIHHLFVVLKGRRCRRQALILLSYSLFLQRSRNKQCISISFVVLQQTKR